LVGRGDTASMHLTLLDLSEIKRKMP